MNVEKSPLDALEHCKLAKLRAADAAISSGYSGKYIVGCFKIRALLGNEGVRIVIRSVHLVIPWNHTLNEFKEGHCLIELI